MKISIKSNFHYRRHKFLSPGDYRVPADISQAIADQAVKAGAGAWVAPPPDDVVERTEITGDDVWIADPEKAGRKRGRPRKGAAPENKALDLADRDDKSALE